MSALLRSSRGLLRALRAPPSLLAASRGAAGLAPLLRRLDEDVRRHGRLAAKDLAALQHHLGPDAAVTSSQALLVIRCCGELVPEELPEDRTRLVKKIWKKLTQQGVPMDISHYNALLRVYVENNHNFSPEEFLKQLETKGLEPNRVTYQRLMWHHCQRGDVESASNILEVMKEKKMPLSEAVLDALVLGHVRQNNLEGAHSVLTAMSAAGLNPTSKTYAIIMGGSAKQGNLEKIKELMKECEGKEIYFTDKDLLEVVEEFAAGGHREHISFIIDQMQKTAGYNQEAINVILRLINRGHLDEAFQILQSMRRSTPQNSEIGHPFQSAFFVKHLVKSNAPTDSVIAFCDRIQKEGISSKANMMAAEAALQNGNVKLALALFKSIQSAGDIVKQHFFWPILVTKAKANDVTGMLDIVRVMGEGYNIPVATETLKEYVLPNLINKRDPSKIVESIRETGAALHTIVRSTLLYLLGEKRSKEAADIAQTYGTRGSLTLYTNPIINALKVNNDIDSFVKLVTLSYYDNQNRKTQEDSEISVDFQTEHREAVGKLLNGLVCQSTKEFNGEMLSVILRKFLQNGLGITSKWADEIQKNLGDHITGQVSQLLTELVSEDLKVISIEKGVMPPVRRTPQQWLNVITAVEARGENADGFKRQYLGSLIRSKQFDKVEETIQQLNESKIPLTSGLCAQILDMYSELEQVEKALEYCELAVTQNSDFTIDTYKILKLVQLMVKGNQFDKAIEILLKHKSEAEAESSFVRDSISWQILNTLAETGDVEKTNKMFNVLEENNFVKVSNFILGSLVKVNIVNDDIDKALDTFEMCTQKYHATPWKSELSKKFILSENAQGLQRLTDLSTAVHGEVNSLYDLVFSFVECGRIKQARRILETPGMRIKNYRFNSVCEHYGAEGKVDYLESLLEATSGLSHIDRSEIFQQLLQIYIKADESEKALGLWTLLQEDGLPPSDKFLIQLAKYLESKNIPVTFVVPNVDTAKVERKVVVEKSALQRKFIEPKVPINNTISNQIVKLIDAGEVDESAKLVYDSLKSGVNVSTSMLRLVLNKIVTGGKVELLENIGTVLNEDAKKMVTFENKRCDAYCKAGRIDDYLKELENNIDSATDEDLSQVENIFPKGGILGLLTSQPNYYKQVKAISDKYASRGIKTPMHSLWVYNFLQNNHEEAKIIWNEHLINSDKILFRAITKAARADGDVNLIPKLLEYLKQSPNVTPRTLGSLYSLQLDMLREKKMFTECNEVLKLAIADNIKLQDFNNTTLVKLKEEMQFSGKEFEYYI